MQNVHTYIRTYVHTYIHTHIHTHTYTCHSFPNSWQQVMCIVLPSWLFSSMRDIQPYLQGSAAKPHKLEAKREVPAHHGCADRHTFNSGQFRACSGCRPIKKGLIVFRKEAFSSFLPGGKFSCAHATASCQICNVYLRNVRTRCCLI